ncbi:PepSY domain-containing protein [Paractinoplanes rishiriensis]|uniref:PepSY domain-containing protein n=1 Tax=Paractinoplanes rishiriensis TaxID=1050105 RepID=A0A919MX41_9ACTN|nr:PepSY domain-containing protein [Actinoplanes rishiriensis]GIE95315.1 hypothetical protein Ari01nite_27800 [Actinoplanes rishiriensis]
MKKRIVIPTVAAVAALGIGGGVWATAANASDVTGADRDRVASAATQAVGGGEAVEVETSDDQGEAYEVEVRKPDGTEVDVALDKDLKVLSQAADAPDGTDADDRALTDAERTSAEQAAIAAVGAGSTVADVEADGDGFEVEVVGADKKEWDVDLDAGFKVLSKTEDN